MKDPTNDRKERSKTKRRKIIDKMLIILAILLSVEFVALLWLFASVPRYDRYWKDKAQEGGEITYVALGDSAAQGIGASSPMRGYVGLIAKSFEEKTGKKVRIVNLSKSGAIVEDCLRDQIPKLKDYNADLVTVEIGANDVKKMNPAKFKKDFEELLPKLPSGTYVSNMPLFNSRRSSTLPAKDQSKVIEELVKQDKRLHFVDLEKQTSEHQSIFGFAPDIFHPNNLSYKNWYQAFWNEIKKN